MAGETEFRPGALSMTQGFNQPYLGPILRLRTGTDVQASVENQTSETISVHWHGLLIPGDVDGGPHNPIAPGVTWQPVLPVDQPPATLWYHTHVHGRTAAGVYGGLAGVLIIEDGRDAERGLPVTAGVDDIVLVLQDKRFDESGRMVYEPTDADIAHGFLGDQILVNGAIVPTATVPAGIVRLRLLNAANGRNFDLALEDGRPLHMIATDQGFLPAPLEAARLRLTPGERAEVLVDFTGGATRLVSLPHTEIPGAGGMGHDMGMAPLKDPFEAPFPVVAFTVDRSARALVTTLPAGALADPEEPLPDPVESRNVVLNDSMMMPGQPRAVMAGHVMAPGQAMGGPQPGASPDMPEQVFGINARPFDMARIEYMVAVGSVERWTVGGEEMGHPFHIHGARFRVVAPEEQAGRPEHAGWKDTILVEGRMELLVQFRTIRRRRKSPSCSTAMSSNTRTAG